MPSTYTTAAIPDLTGRVFVVTGGNTGIGYETVLQLTKKNATVIMASRSEDRAKAAIAKIEKESGITGKIEFLRLVLNDLKQVSSASTELLSRHEKIDVLINNAGIMAGPFALSADGIEDQFATNHVGHFLLTKKLIPALLKGNEPRIVNLSSSYHAKAPLPEGIRFDKINDTKSMNNWERYGQSKLSNVLFTKQLNKLYGDKIVVNSVHPGFVDTELTRGVVQNTGSWFKPIMDLVKKVVALTPQDGALTSLYAATSPDVGKDRFYWPIAKDSTDTETIPLGKDEALAQRLWDFTEALILEKIGAV
ncbi:UNVERIFIED_CONTAM: hypothetical protein HDU68_012670 [Siphonaria sp. JEL0065]|nr:hypothetical protein HDU68_012670 [Siphonaria sp. JEL0065]